jgi:CheY-like chemotaxis protein
MQHQSSLTAAKNITLALIDDDPVVELILKRQVLRLPEEEKPEVLSFDNGPSALENFQERLAQGQKLPELVLLDLNMPKLSGWEVLEELVQLPPEELPVIYIISSSIDPDDQLRANHHPHVRGFLSKPIFQETLFELFRKAS